LNVLDIVSSYCLTIENIAKETYPSWRLSQCCCLFGAEKQKS
jgi:hypothetical protein